MKYSSLSALPRHIASGVWKSGHVQGIAVDLENGFLYYSFTTMIVKTDLEGNLIGWADGIVGHLGCMDFCQADGRVYASLEYKDDCIGTSILEMVGSTQEPQIGFYIAIFDGARITRPGMNATRDGIMTTVWLGEVVKDYKDSVTLNGREVKHRHGCSGIDGLTFGPEYGTRGGKYYLNVTYGIYDELDRDDNDHQVILQYDTADWSRYEQPLLQEDMHRSGPEAPRNKFFVYTGNTNWGVQNYEYDEASGNWLMAVYRGNKPSFPNRTLYVVDGSKAPVEGCVKSGDDTLPAKLLTLAKQGLEHPGSGVYGYDFPRYGTTGLASLGENLFYISHDGRCEQGQFSDVYLYRWTGDTPSPFELVK